MSASSSRRPLSLGLTKIQATRWSTAVPASYDPEDDYPVYVLRAARKASSANPGSLGIVIGKSSGQRRADRREQGRRHPGRGRLDARDGDACPPAQRRQRAQPRGADVQHSRTPSRSRRHLRRDTVLRRADGTPRHRLARNGNPAYEKSGELPPLSNSRGDDGIVSAGRPMAENAIGRPAMEYHRDAPGMRADVRPRARGVASYRARSPRQELRGRAARCGWGSAVPNAPGPSRRRLGPCRGTGGCYWCGIPLCLVPRCLVPMPIPCLVP